MTTSSLQGIEEEEQKALSKLPSIHMMMEEGHERRVNQKNNEFKWDLAKGARQGGEDVGGEGNNEQGRREVVITGKGLGVIAEDDNNNDKNIDKNNDSDSAVHLDYSSDSLRSDQGRSCEREICNIGTVQPFEILPSKVGGGRSVVGAVGQSRFDRSAPVFDQSAPILKARATGLQRSVSDVVEAEFPSPFSDSRSNFCRIFFRPNLVIYLVQGHTFVRFFLGQSWW